MFRRCKWHLLLVCGKFRVWYPSILSHSLQEDFVLTVMRRCSDFVLFGLLRFG